MSNRWGVTPSGILPYRRRSVRADVNFPPCPKLAQRLKCTSSSQRFRCRQRASRSPTYLVVHGTPNLPVDQWSGRRVAQAKKTVPCQPNVQTGFSRAAVPPLLYLAIARLQGNAWQPVKRRRPRCIVIAGPNGAGKTTFAREYLPRIARVVHFVNADLIAGGAVAAEAGIGRDRRRSNAASGDRSARVRAGGFCIRNHPQRAYVRAPNRGLEACRLPHRNRLLAS